MSLSIIEQEKILALVKREVVITIGCTEPVAVALCTAKSTELLANTPDKITVSLSANVLKNAMGVGIPGTGGMTGLPIAIALGALIGKPQYGLEVLKDCTPEAVETAKKMIDDKRISIELKPTCEKLYIEVKTESGDQTATAIISGQHTNFSFLQKNESVMLDKKNTTGCDGSGEIAVELSLEKVYEFSMTTPLKNIDFILESARVNKAAAETSFKGNYGHGLGKMLGATENKIMGNDMFTSILSYTSAACDARMAGAMIPVMSNSGSGNQGIAATLPVVIYAEKNRNTDEELTRALMLGHLTSIYIKQHLGRLSALCGCVVAATGTSCGIVHLMGGKYPHVSYAVKNMIGNLTGMICDGAKPSCSMKLTSGVSTAIFSAMMAIDNKYVTSVEGIIDDDVDKCIRNLTLIGTEGMSETDRYVLEIMTHK